MQPAYQDKAIKRFRRYHGYDYSRGAAVFVSFHLEPRLPMFGRVTGEKMVYSPVGEIARRVILKESCRTLGAQLKEWKVMPEHIHLRIYLRLGQSEPLKKLGQFVYNVKAWIRNNAKREMGIELRWLKNYHDWLCLSREIIEIVDKYIENNPLKWWLMHGNPLPLKVIEPLVSDVLPGGEWWTAAVEKGYTLVGTWISPRERAAWGELMRRDAPIIRASQYPLAMVYRPKGDEPGLFAEGRYLVLSRVVALGTARGVGWHGINDALEEIVCAGGGVGLYVKRVGGRLDWHFRQGDWAGLPAGLVPAYSRRPKQAGNCPAGFGDSPVGGGALC